MIINTKEIEKLIFENEYSIYEITQQCGITSRTSLNKARNNKNIDNLALETVKKLQDFINEEEKKMKNKLTPELLNATYANEGGTMDLEFQVNNQMVYVRNVEVPKNVDEFYWDDDENVEKAIQEAEDDTIEFE